ncbi:MAG: peptidylprolyl isomerase [Alphaproteobacteria bacterium]|uniref:peptidylprolyl isomerase n=1 Tax=Pacificispira sp. TaxID=2888761 RepID=UPI001B2D733C|nr:peptidylprolyl isomerase [Alphaproteobacteria bacterium]MBO6861856.1 peptidylprolyl isomerase [Alphaproteobacteria bacterium]MEC9266558.1 peptidylprolyl isomerase [Pseudomonadota bacterium]
MRFGINRFGQALVIAGTLLTIGVPGAFLSQQAIAQQNVMRIAAVVNDDIISVLDLEQRLRLVALSSNLRLDQQTRQRLMPQVLRGLIDERLQAQEAENNGITISDREVDDEVRILAERNNIPPVQFPAFLSSRGIELETLRTQIRSQLAWARYAGRRLARQVEVGEEEIDEELQRLREVSDQPQKRTYEIFLGVDNPDEANQIRQDAERLLSQIQGGANFSSVANGFSESGTAAQGGDLGWIAPGQLPEELDEALADLQPGMISPPIRTFAGYYLLYVTDVQRIGRDPANTEISLFQLIQRVPGHASDQDRQAVVEDLRAAIPGIDSCEGLKRYGESRQGANVAAAQNIKLGELPPQVQEAVANLQPGQTSEPINNGNAILMITICERSDPGLTLPSRDQIKERLGTQRLELLVRRKMRDLRREAFIDIRL